MKKLLKVLFLLSLTPVVAVGGIKGSSQKSEQVKSWVSCSGKLHSDNRDHYSHIDQSFPAAVTFAGLGGLGYSFFGAGISSAGVVGGTGGLTTTAMAGGIIYDKLNEFSQHEYYGQAVLGQSRSNLLGPDLVSFLRLVKRKISIDRSAVTPSNQEIMDVLNFANEDLSACYDYEDDFFRPTKRTLLQLVIEELE